MQHTSFHQALYTTHALCNINYFTDNNSTDCTLVYTTLKFSCNHGIPPSAFVCTIMFQTRSARDNYAKRLHFFHYNNIAIPATRQANLQLVTATFINITIININFHSTVALCLTLHTLFSSRCQENQNYYSTPKRMQQAPISLYELLTQ